MRVAVVHGYFLHESGSGTYVRELTRELVRQGHEVTLVCQERSPEIYDFIDSAHVLDDANAAAATVFERERLYAGSCRFVRPNLHGSLLVYVNGPFPGFAPEEVEPFQDTSADRIEAYAIANISAMRAVLAEWPVDLLLANHALMQPWVVRWAAGEAIPYVVTVHGSEINFSLRRDARLAPYALDGLAGAAAVVAVSRASADDLLDWAGGHGLDLVDKTEVVAPGIDPGIFAPASSKAVAVDELRRDVVLPVGFDLGPSHDILAFAGSLRWTKGVQHALAAVPLVAASRPNVRFLVAGDGPARRDLEALVAALQAGDLASARRLTRTSDELRTTHGYGPVVREGTAKPAGARVAFLGQCTQAQVARVFAAADVSVAPSVFPEAIGLVTIEALAAGSLALASYHSGAASLADILAEELGDPAFRGLAPGGSFTGRLADLIVHGLSTYPTADPEFRARLHGLAVAHFPVWEQVATRYLELGATSDRRGAAPEKA